MEPVSRFASDQARPLCDPESEDLDRGRLSCEEAPLRPGDVSSRCHQCPSVRPSVLPLIAADDDCGGTGSHSR